MAAGRGTEAGPGWEQEHILVGKEVVVCATSASVWAVISRCTTVHQQHGRSRCEEYASKAQSASALACIESEHATDASFHSES